MNADALVAMFARLQAHGVTYGLWPAEVEAARKYPVITNAGLHLGSGEGPSAFRYTGPFFAGPSASIALARWMV